ncbi:MAG: glycine cleavage system aminomethyltransferase GcvT [Calditrichaeota bacterium]|nr:MAG: glycine cleavage system aminomethyltransferase GcvT [Calditrichota bacterium]
MEAKKTALYDVHVRLGARMVPFAGFLMPIQYTSILEEHRKVRTSVGVFDVSHMGEIVIRGESAESFVNYLTTNNVARLQVNQAQYTVMCYDHGGIVDDLICYRFADRYLLVVNAANTEKDFQWILTHRPADVQVENISERITQLAVQGKNAEPTLQKLTRVDLSAIKFYWFQEGELAGVPMVISRTGYTGEPGFELYFDRQYSEKVWDAVFEAGRKYDIAPIGLGARDSLRLEKKYCLYGNDIDQNTNPLEAGLGWIVKFDKGDFIGREALLKAKESGLKRKLMGFVVEGRIIPRKDYPILVDGKQVGQVTSGAYSPILEKNIGLGYVAIEYARIGQQITIEARGRSAPATIVKTPFV